MYLKVNFLGICYASRKVKRGDIESERWDFVEIGSWNQKNMSTLMLCI